MDRSSIIQRLNRRVRMLEVRWANNLRIRRMAGQVARYSPRAVGHGRVVMFNASTRLEGLSLNAAFAMLVGWSLRLVGVPVEHFVCWQGLAPCVLGTRPLAPYSRPPCGRCVAQSRSVYAHGCIHKFLYQPDPELGNALQKASLAELMVFQYQGIPLGELVLPSLRWILRRHHLNDDEATRFLYRQYLLSAFSLAGQFGRFLDEKLTQAVVVFNGMFYPEAIARWVAQRRGLRVITHEVGLQPFSAFFTTGDATAYPIQIPESFDLSAGQEARLNQYLEQRFQGNFSMAGIRFWPEMRGLGEDFWRRVQSFRQVVPIFTNVIFDTSQGHANVVFPDMFSWLDLVLELIRAHPETFFVIRAHPDEIRPGKESRQSVAQWVRQHAVDQLPNVQFVDSQEYLSSYELIRRSKFVMVYNSTIGLEAALMGMPVLCGGRARFTQLPIVFFPATVEQYRQQAEDFLSRELITFPEEYRRNARRFMYYQLFRASLPFDEFLKEDGIWQGYVVLKQFGWQQLLPQNSATLRTVVGGILEDKAFYLEE